LEAREDIYRFFGEAIANVIHHAQPPQGTATQVQVSLEQQEGKCVLSIENDGSIVDPTAFDITPAQRQRGGYGTKLMETIAVELPAGSFEKIALPEGGVRVRLTWNLLFNTNSSNLSDNSPNATQRNRFSATLFSHPGRPPRSGTE
jgi:signal transduction histidine kinase